MRSKKARKRNPFPFTFAAKSLNLLADILVAIISAVIQLASPARAIARHDCFGACRFKCLPDTKLAAAQRGIFREEECLRREFGQTIAEGAICVR